jgi:hypothetical protein
MDTVVKPASAKIYQFPPPKRAEPDRPAPKGTTSHHVIKTVYGNSWYHDAAIQDAEVPRPKR